jgi:hypothetical protein
MAVGYSAAVYNIMITMLQIALCFPVERERERERERFE